MYIEPFIFEIDKNLTLSFEFCKKFSFDDFLLPYSFDLNLYCELKNSE